MLSASVFPPVSTYEPGDQCSQNLAWILDHQSPRQFHTFCLLQSITIACLTCKTSQTTSNINVTDARVMKQCTIQTSVGTPHSCTLHPPHITAALTRCLHLSLATKMAPGCHNKRDYHRASCLPTPLPSQWRGRPESQAWNIRREFSEKGHSVIDTSRRADDSQTYQEEGGGNYVRLPGHDASWTGHYIIQRQHRQPLTIMEKLSLTTKE
jgi:hypothetical protein